MEDTELHLAVRLGDISEVQAALSLGLDPNEIGLYDWSPLHEASYNGNLQVVDALLKFKGDPNRIDSLKGFTAMHHAASQGNVMCLDALIKAGGSTNITDDEGRTSLDVARGKCIDLIHKLEENNKPLCKESPQTSNSLQEKSEVRSESTDSKIDANSTDNSVVDFDRLSLASDLSGSSVSSWNSGVRDYHKDLVMGHAILSFEYHKKAQSFKIRVWELQDLILPPVETSMIQDIFVRSYLLPDKTKKSKRSTEYISASKLLKCNQSPQEFSPVSIKFTKPLEYKEITQEVVDQKTVYIEIRIRQKYTWRNFVLATWNTPMCTAVRYLTKEKHPLTPKVSTSIPSNMKIYSAHKLQVVSNRGFASSCPNSRTASKSSLNSSFKEPRASSDPDFQLVTVHKTCNPSIELTLPSDEESDGPSDLHEVKTSKLTQDSISVLVTDDIETEHYHLDSVTTE